MDRIRCVIGTAGHIDHGKTSLVKALTGIDTDRLKEEKKRGLTIDLGFAYLDFEDEKGRVRAAIVDVPGHERFIRNMLAGTTGIDMVLFVVAADDGIMPQTIEHLDIVRLLGIKKAVFVITKCDLVNAQRVNEVERDVRLLIKDTPLEGSPFARVSSVTGMGVPELKILIREALAPRADPEEGFFRLPIDRCFAIKGFGTVVTGTVASGSVEKGDEALCFPSGARVKVRGIQSLYLETEEVSSGQRAALNISGVSHNEIERGFMLVTPLLSEYAGLASNPAKGSALKADCLIEILSDKDGTRRFTPIKNNSILKLHHLTGEALAVVRFAGRKEAAPGGRVFGRFVLKRPLLVLRGDRFILRNPSINSTIGGAVVILPYLSRHLTPGLDKMATVAGVTDLQENIPEILRVLLPEKGGVAFEKKIISLMLNLRDTALSGLLGAGGPASGEFTVAGEFIVNIKRVSELKKRIIALLAGFHWEKPLEAGMKEEQIFKVFKAELTQGLDKEKSAVLFKSILDGMISEGALRREGGAVALGSHRSASTGADAEIEREIVKLFSSSGFSALNIGEIRMLPFKQGEVTRVLGYLQRIKKVIKLKEDTFISDTAMKAATEKLTAHIKAKGSIRASEFRDLLGVGRKLAIEILEYLDRERLTLRQGDIRTLRQ